MPSLARTSVGRLFDDPGPGIEVLVDAMAKAHQPERIVLVLGAIDIVGDIAFPGHHVLQHLDDFLVGPAVEGSGQRQDPGRDRTEDVGFARPDQAHRGRRTVLTMIGVEDQQHVERRGHDRVGLVGLGRHREHQVKEVGGVVEVIAGIHVGLMGPVLVDPGDHRRKLAPATA